MRGEVEVIRDRPNSVDVDEFLARPLFAHLATASEQGPRVSPVWFLWEEGAVWVIGSRRDDSFPARVEHDGRCSVAVVDFDRKAGLVQHVGLRGAATVEPFERERARRLLARYLGDDEAGWDERFRQTLCDADNVLIRFVPATAVARDVSYGVGAYPPA
jgi:Pyridoxamine 5'-phosphate oxidase